jgi:hypothetical protein
LLFLEKRALRVKEAGSESVPYRVRKIVGPYPVRKIGVPYQVRKIVGR